MSTIRRDHLFRLAKAGRLVAIASYHFDDMMGESRSSGTNLPVEIAPDNFNERKQGVYYVPAYDFKGNSGRAYNGGDKSVVTLYVHSNCNHTFRIKPKQ